MLKRILLISFLSLFMANFASAQILSTSALKKLANGDEKYAEKAGRLMKNAVGRIQDTEGNKVTTIDDVVKELLANGVNIDIIATALKSYGLDANGVVFSLVSSGIDADAAVNSTQAKFPGTTAESLATTLVEAKINYNARVAAGDIEGETTTVDTTTTAPRASFTTAGSGSPLTTEQFITITEEANS
jgi:hypothetical protein